MQVIYKESLKINLGSRDRKIPGFKNIDIYEHPGVDYVGDVSDLSRFKDREVSEIFASNILEHFPHTKTLDVLKEWHRVLEDGGRLYLSVPNFRRAIQIYLKTGFKDWIQNFIMGDQAYPTAFHYAIFDEVKLIELVMAAGFKSAETVIDFGFADQKDCSTIRSNLDGQHVCLNMVVTK